VLSAAALAAFATAPAAAQQGSGGATLVGTVVDARSGQAIAGAMVDASPGLGRTATDAEGRFQLRLRGGSVMIHVTQLGYRTQQQLITLQGEAPAPLTFSLEPEPVVLERLDVVLDRFAARRQRVAMSTRVLDRAELAGFGGHDMAQAIRDAAVPVVPCNRSGSQCVYSRGQVVAPAVYVDDRPALGGLAELATYSPSDMHHVEIFGSGRMIRVYTMRYVDAVARGRQRLRAYTVQNCPDC
jgi:hypothetical protein